MGYGYTAALINYAFLAHAVLTMDEAAKAMDHHFSNLPQLPIWRIQLQEYNGRKRILLRSAKAPSPL